MTRVHYTATVLLVVAAVSAVLSVTAIVKDVRDR